MAKTWLSQDEYHVGVSGTYANRTAMKLFEEAGVLLADWRPKHAPHPPAIGIPEGPYLAQAGAPPREYLDLLARYPAAMYQAAPEGGDVARTIARIWHVTLDRLAGDPIKNIKETLFGRQREFFWYYKAGFNAARLLEDDSKWQPAAVVYQKLVSAGGTRSDEAKSRLSRLRLEHFLWEQ